MGPDGYVHILYGGSQPPSGIFESLYSPNSSCAIESKKVQENAVHLLLDLEMEGKIDVLEPCKEVLIFVYK